MTLGKQTTLSIPSARRLKDIDSSLQPIILMPSKMPKGSLGDLHVHQRGQLIYPHQGRYVLHLHNRLISGSAHQATWVPPQQIHTVRAIDDLWVHNVYIDTTVFPHLPQTVKIFKVTKLLSALLEQGATITKAPQRAEELKHITYVIADQIVVSEAMDSLILPISEHPKIRQVINALLQQPSDKRKLIDWAQRVHCSERTLSRLFVKETGMTFSQWRQRLHVKEAIDHLQNGRPISAVAIELNYASQSAFTQMFSRITGQPPSQFLLR